MSFVYETQVHFDELDPMQMLHNSRFVAHIERAITSPVHEITQADGRIRRWARVPEMDNRYLRVILLSDGETVHNAFFDRRFAS